jgi:RNA polymerase sigma-70 factor (ECF subfamily)
VPDGDLVQRVLDGDAASFELIMRRHNQRLFRVARSILGDDAEAEDVMQEAYFRAYKHLGQFEGRASFSTWLTKIAVYEAMARRRKRSRLRVVSLDEAEANAMVLPAVNRDAADHASLQELQHLLTSAVDALPAELRVVFTLRMVEHLSTEETAECLDLSPANVKVRLHRARAQLQSSIERRLGAESRRLYGFDGGRCDRVVASVMARVLQDR